MKDHAEYDPFLQKTFKISIILTPKMTVKCAENRPRNDIFFCLTVNISKVYQRILYFIAPKSFSIPEVYFAYTSFSSKDSNKNWKNRRLKVCTKFVLFPLWFPPEMVISKNRDSHLEQFRTLFNFFIISFSIPPKTKKLWRDHFLRHKMLPKTPLFWVTIIFDSAKWSPFDDLLPVLYPETLSLTVPELLTNKLTSCEHIPRLATRARSKPCWT